MSTEEDFYNNWLKDILLRIIRNEPGITFSGILEKLKWFQVDVENPDTVVEVYEALLELEKDGKIYSKEPGKTEELDWGDWY